MLVGCFAIILGLLVLCAGERPTNEVWTAKVQPFRVAQYNVLASVSASNHFPWFLYPLNLSDTSRKVLMNKYDERDDSGNHLHSFGDGFGGELSEAQVGLVEERNRAFQLQWREPKLFATIKGLDADILSFIEIDRYEEFKAALPGYESIFVSRPRGKHLDGVALFWRTSRFEKLGNPESLKFEDGQVQRSKTVLFFEAERMMLAVALKDKTDPDKVIVATSMHLMRIPDDSANDPQTTTKQFAKTSVLEGDQAKSIMEMTQMMSRISSLVEAHRATGVVLLGDFNAGPQSLGRMFLTQGWQDCPEADKQMTDVFDDLQSSKAPKYCTTASATGSMWIDYILMSSRTLEVVNHHVDPCPSTGIPDDSHASDHLPISATLRYADGAAALPLCGATSEARNDQPSLDQDVTKKEISPVLKSDGLTEDKDTNIHKDLSSIVIHGGPRLNTGTADNHGVERIERDLDNLEVEVGKEVKPNHV